MCAAQPAGFRPASSSIWCLPADRGGGADARTACEMKSDYLRSLGSDLGSPARRRGCRRRCCPGRGVSGSQSTKSRSFS